MPVVSTANALLVAGRSQDKPILTALEPDTGNPLWEQNLPDNIAQWGVAVARIGQIQVTLANGMLLCLGPK